MTLQGWNQDQAEVAVAAEFEAALAAEEAAALMRQRRRPPVDDLSDPDAAPAAIDRGDAPVIQMQFDEEAATNARTASRVPLSGQEQAAEGHLARAPSALYAAPLRHLAGPESDDDLLAPTALAMPAVSSIPLRVPAVAAAIRVDVTQPPAGTPVSNMQDQEQEKEDDGEQC